MSDETLFCFYLILCLIFTGSGVGKQARNLEEFCVIFSWVFVTLPMTLALSLLCWATE